MQLKRLISVALVLVISACASTNAIKANHDRNESIDTSTYKTFAWLSPTKMLSGPENANPIMKVRIDDAIEAAFEKKGYTLVSDPESADFTISYTIGSREKIKVNSYPTTYRTGFGWGGRYYGGVAMGTETTVRQYNEGRLAIDVFDVKTKQPAWHGWATKKITSSDKESPMTTIQAIIDEVVINFQVKP